MGTPLAEVDTDTGHEVVGTVGEVATGLEDTDLEADVGAGVEDGIGDIPTKKKKILLQKARHPKKKPIIFSEEKIRALISMHMKIFPSKLREGMSPMQLLLSRTLT